jgi:integrase
VKRAEGKAYRTLLTYELVVRRASEAFGNLRLDAVGSADIRRLIAEIQADKGARTAEQTRTVLHAAFEYALEDDLIGRNPTAMVKPPKVTRGDRTILGIDQVHELFDGTRGDWHHAIYVVAATTGLREGELLGLSWSDVNLDAQILHVRRQQQRQSGKGFVLTELKTAKSKRMVPLVNVAVAALRDHKALQRQRRKELGLEWMDTGRVFSSQFGSPMDPANLRRRLYSDLKRLELPRVTVHELRHTASTLMAGSQIPVHATMAVMGHSRSSTTLDIYTQAGSSDLALVRNRLNTAFENVVGIASNEAV